MSNENLMPEPISVSEMLRVTGANTERFMIHVAEHIERLEARIKELESKANEPKRKRTKAV